jgi:hypothetical protein
MTCLENIIGIIGCGAPTDDANLLFINQLPGVSISNIDALADGSDQQTFLEVWADVKLRAMKKFEIQVKAAINKCYRITDKEIINCLVCANSELFAVALWYLMGTEMMIERTSTDTLNRWTTVDLDKAEQLKAEFFSEYDSALKDAVDSMDMTIGDCLTDECVECNDDVKFVTQLP